jgi:hypothetical protein
MHKPTAFPFQVYVEVRDLGGPWVREAQGSSYEWLAERLDEYAEVYDRVRLVAYWGDEVELPPTEDPAPVERGYF